MTAKIKQVPLITDLYRALHRVVLSKTPRSDLVVEHAQQVVSLAYRRHAQPVLLVLTIDHANGTNRPAPVNTLERLLDRYRHVHNACDGPRVLQGTLE